MIKIKAGIGFLILLAICLITNNIFVLANYFAALFLHEYCHYFVAKKRGYELNSVFLGINGLSIDLKTHIKSEDEFLIAIAGPACNIILCLLCSSLWWMIPESYFYTKEFFNANIVLAIFNLLPIYPLDGSRILNSILYKKLNLKQAKFVGNIICIVLSVVFFAFFVWSCFNQINVYYIIFAVFFLTNLNSKNTFDLVTRFNYLKLKKTYKISYFYVDKSNTLLELYKKIKPNSYTVFLCEINGISYQITEQKLILYVEKFSYNTSIEGALRNITTYK